MSAFPKMLRLKITHFRDKNVLEIGDRNTHFQNDWTFRDRLKKSDIL